MGHQIYIILYTEYNGDSEIEDVFAYEKYFTNKDKAIIHLLEQDYRHICDDEYSAAWYLHAEIILLNKEELWCIDFYCLVILSIILVEE